MQKLALDSVVTENLSSLVDIRDTAVHFHNDDGVRYIVFTLGVAALRNYQHLAKEWSFRQATARPRRTKVDWAWEVAQLLDTRYADSTTVTLVCDNLNTHTKGAFYETFPAERARNYVRRLKLVHTPKHGSWLNIAECELSCLTSQCLAGRRLGELDVLQAEIQAWSEKTNAKQRGVDWQFQIDDARSKLKKLYPTIKV